MFSSTICKNTGTWEAGSMICRMEKVSKYGVMVLHTRGNFLTVKNMAKGNTNFHKATFTKDFLSTISLMVKVI